MNYRIHTFTFIETKISMFFFYSIAGCSWWLLGINTILLRLFRIDERMLSSPQLLLLYYRFLLCLRNRCLEFLLFLLFSVSMMMMMCVECLGFILRALYSLFLEYTYGTNHFAVLIDTNRNGILSIFQLHLINRSVLWVNTKFRLLLWNVLFLCIQTNTWMYRWQSKILVPCKHTKTFKIIQIMFWMCVCSMTQLNAAFVGRDWIFALTNIEICCELFIIDLISSLSIVVFIIDLLIIEYQLIANDGIQLSRSTDDKQLNKQ